MRTIFKSLLLCIVLCITACSVDSVTEPSQQKDENSFYEMPSSTPKEDVDYFVSESMLSKYLRLVCKGREVDLIEPVVEEGSTLAYYVQFSNDKGWNLISADTRVTPVLSEAPSGVFHLDGDGPEGGILGTLKNVEDARNNPEASVQAIWKFLFPEMYATKTKSFANTKSSRVFITGMWMPVDTVFAYDTTFSGRTIATKWGQREPWDAYTPLDTVYANFPHSAVGCTAVASGQILYRYLYLTNGLYNIPSSAYMQDGLPHFTSYTSDWSGFALDSTDNNTAHKNKTAAFLSWLGHQMGMVYSFNGSSPGWNNFVDLLDNYLNFSSTGTYDYYTVFSNVGSHIPVCIYAAKDINDIHGHTFIVDAYERVQYQARVRYIFDSNHPVTQEEYERLPNWMFMEPGPGSNYDPDKEETWLMVPIDIMDNTYFLMNWGYDGNCDDATYLARSKQYFYNEDFSYLYYSTQSFPGINWQYTTPQDTVTYAYLRRILYNFTRIN